VKEAIIKHVLLCETLRQAPCCGTPRHPVPPSERAARLLRDRCVAACRCPRCSGPLESRLRLSSTLGRAQQALGWESPRWTAPGLRGRERRARARSRAWAELPEERGGSRCPRWAGGWGWRSFADSLDKKRNFIQIKVLWKENDPSLPRFQSCVAVQWTSLHEPVVAEQQLNSAEGVGAVWKLFIMN